MDTSPRPVPRSRRQRAPRHGGSRWGARPALVLALAGTLLATTGAVVSAASDEPDLMTMKLRIEGGYYTEKALSQDSDGDGWTDWVERLNGTDPKDPASHPTISHVEVVGTTAYVQSHQVPDHLVVIDLALPEGVTTVTELAAMVASLAGMSEASPLHSQLMAGLDQLGSGRLDEIIKLTQAAHASTGGLPAGAHGRDISLISAGPGTWEAWKGVQETLTFVQNNDIGVGTTTDGNPYVTVTNNEGSQTHVFHGKDSISSTLITKFTDDDGTVVVHWTRIENGVVVGYGKKVTKTDGTQEYWDYDGDGNSTGHGVVQTGPVGGASAGPGPSTGPTAGGQPSSAPSSQPSGEPSSQPSSEPSGDASTEPEPSASASYVNPDADSVLVMPSRTEIAKRIAFLSGVRVRTVQNGPTLPETPILDEPGVADPIDPECKGQMCPKFVVVSSPELTVVHGGDPINPDHAPDGPGPSAYDAYFGGAGSTPGSGGYGEGTLSWPGKP